MKRNLLLLLAICLTAINVNAQTPGVTSVAIVGEAVGGWPGDAGNPGPTDVHQMTSTDGENWSINGLVVTNAQTGGGAKFRANNAWDINWGAAEFPSGTGTQGGANIVTIGGTYDVTFNSTTGVYTFGGGPPIPVVKLVGTAATGGTLDMTTSDAVNFTLTNVTLLDGTAQFDIDGNAFGSDTFPTGIISDPSLFIPVTAGTYSSVTVNTSTGDYSFVAAPVFPSISIVGSGAGGWPGSPENPGPIDNNQLTTTDGIIYTLNALELTAGEAKFRQNNDWAVNWGAADFPSGVGTQDGANIVTVPGTYVVTFNRTTGEYTFSVPSISIVGPGAGGWPGSPENPGPIDNNQLTTTDGVNYSISGLTLTDGEAKFRQNNDWTVNWGAAAFPAGTGTQGGANIPTVAGTYDITFKRTTGDFSFSPLASVSFSSSNFKVYPNPTQNNWNFTSLNNTIETIQIVNVLGKTIMTIAPNSTSANVDASALNAGIYFAKIATAGTTQTVKLIKN